jgi:hypothetical protein
VAKFKDSTGREWTLSIPNFRVVTRLRADAGFDLNRVATDGGLGELVYGDAEPVMAAAWALAGKPTDATVTLDDFHAAIDSAALVRLRQAVGEAVFDFFHPQQAATMAARLREIMTPSASSETAGTSPGSAG